MLTVAIIGAGIGGLATARLLAQEGHQVTIFDRFDAPAPVGSGLVVQPVGQDVLRTAGALDDALALGNRVRAMAGKEVTEGRRVLDVSYGDGFGLALHRASLFHALFKAATVAGVCIETGAEVTGIETGIDGACLCLDTARTQSFDLVVNASGARSPLSPVRTRLLPYGAIWGTVPWPDDTSLPADQLQQRYRAANRMIGILPSGRLPEDPRPIATLFWSMPRDAYVDWLGTPLETWKGEAEGLWPEMAPFLAGISDHGQMTMARYAHGALLNPVKGRVVHLGDAAHQTSPQLGQGANMALLDAAALATALRDPDLDMGLRAYRLARRGHVWFYQLLSAAFTPQYQSDSRILPVLRDRVLYPLSQVPPVPRILTRLVSGDLLPPLGALQSRELAEDRLA